MTPIRAIPPMYSDDTVATLKGLLSLAQRGEVLGIAYVTVNKRQRWGYGISGVAYSDPESAVCGSLIVTDALKKLAMSE